MHAAMHEFTGYWPVSLWAWISLFVLSILVYFADKTWAPRRCGLRFVTFEFRNYRPRLALPFPSAPGVLTERTAGWQCKRNLRNIEWSFEGTLNSNRLLATSSPARRGKFSNSHSYDSTCAVFLRVGRSVWSVSPIIGPDKGSYPLPSEFQSLVCRSFGRFPCRCRNFDKTSIVCRHFVAFRALVMSLFQGRVACHNFPLTGPLYYWTNLISGPCRLS